METFDQAQAWIRRSHEATSQDVEAALLTEILQAGAGLTLALGQVAAESEVSAVIRCAALDQYVRYEGIGAEMLLSVLVDWQTERIDEVRLAAYQWVFALAEQTGQPVLRGMTKGGSEDWRERLHSDPSPRVRWLAALAQPGRL